MKYTFFHDSYVKASGIDPLRPSPCMSVDFFPVSLKSHRVATAVMAENVKIWEFIESNEVQNDENLQLNFQLVAELIPSTECKTVNIVRWSPDGLFLATGCSSGHVLIWKRYRYLLPEEQTITSSSGFNNNNNNNTSASDKVEDNIAEAMDAALKPSELWRVFKTFKNHDIDILDLSWSPPMLDTEGVVTCLLTVVSFDNKISVVNVSSGETVQEMKSLQKYHKSSVQGCTWDPWGGFFVSQSCDRTARIFNCNQKMYSLQQPVSNSKSDDDNAFTAGSIMKKCEFTEAQFLPKDKCTEENLKRNFLLFKEENPKIHNRRLDVSPDGSILVVPAGQFPNIQLLQESGGKKVEFQDAIFTFARNQWKSPKIVHPGHNHPVTGIRFSPILYKKDLVETNQSPYWMMFAAISKDRLIVYSTEQPTPLYVAHLMHQEMLTDVTWSNCGRMLFVSSWDGYFSVYKFGQSDIPEGYSLEQFDMSSISESDSESIASHKTLTNIKRAFDMKAQNLKQLFSSFKKEGEQPTVKVLQVKRKN